MLPILSLLVAPSLAAAPGAHALPSIPMHAHEASDVSTEALWDAWFSAVDPVHVRSPESLEHRQASLEIRGFHCLTQVHQLIESHWDEFSVEEQEVLRASMPQPVEIERPETDGAEPPMAASEPCFTVGWGNFVYGEHFAVEYEDGVTTANANKFLEELEYSYGVLFDELGWKEPNGVNQYLVLAGIQNGGSAGAYTSVNTCSGVSGGVMPYMIAGEDGFSAGNWYKTMAGHELNHASQFGYASIHEFFWWEATATWVEEYLYPSYNEWSDMVYVYSLVPHIGLNAYAGDSNDQYLFYHTYSMAIFAFYLDEYVGGHDFVLGTWQQAITGYLGGGYSGYDYWMPDVIDDMGEDFDALWAEFLAVNTVTAYSEYAAFYAPETEDSFDSLPASGEDSRDTRPQSLGANFWRFEADACDDDEALSVEFEGDDSVPWTVVLARAEDHTLHDYVVVDVDDGEGSGQINCDGDADLYLVVSPKDEDAVGQKYRWTNADDYSYEFSADLTDPDQSGSGGGGGGGLDEDADETNGGSLGGEKDGCSSVVAAPMALTWLSGALVLGLRRRRD